MTYGSPPPMYGPPPEHPRAMVILAFGILGIVACMPFGIAAWVMGNAALREIDANPGLYGGRGTVNAGRILGMISVALVLLSIVALLGLFLLGGLALTMFHTTCTGTGC